MKVDAFARLAGLGVDELVALILDPSAPAPARAPVGARALAPARPARASEVTRQPTAGARKPAGGRILVSDATPRSPAISGAPLVAPDAPPLLDDMIDRATYRQIHTAVDRWYVVNVMNEEGGNVSRVARRLRVSRKRVRVMWARLKASAGKDDLKKITKGGKPSNAPPAPNIAPLLAKGTYREVHDTVDRWLLGHTLSRVEGNVSQAARDLAVSRKHLRDHLARVKLMVR